MHTVFFSEDDDIVDIRFDKAFKAVFTRDTPRTHQALSGLLSACIGRPLKVLSLIANEPPANAARDRNIRYDIACRFDTEELADVEMTLYSKADEEPREEYYAARLFTAQDIRGANIPYKKLKNVYQVNILADSIRYRDDELVHAFKFYDRQHDLSFDGRMHIITVELEKARRVAEQKTVTGMTPAESWAVFLLYHAERENRALVNEILKMKEDIAMAAENILEFTEAEREWFRNESKLKYELDMQTILYYEKQDARAEGLAEGKVEGRAEGKAEGLVEAEEKSLREKRESAQKMKNAGLAFAQIQEFTGLSATEIEKL
jgi:predicted transposase/invertase (TIGR01784 family)